MRASEIEPDREYIVRVPERESLVYGGARLRARVLRAGFYYEVETITGSAVRGAPFKRHRRSAHPNGVEVKWGEQEVWSNRPHQDKERIHPGRAIVNARAVLEPA